MDKQIKRMNEAVLEFKEIKDSGNIDITYWEDVQGASKGSLGELTSIEYCELQDNYSELLFRAQLAEMVGPDPDKAATETVEPEQVNRHVKPIFQAVDNLKESPRIATMSAVINHTAYALQQEVISTPGHDAGATLELARAIENLTLAIDGVTRDGASKSDQYTDDKIACASRQISDATRLINNA